MLLCLRVGIIDIPMHSFIELPSSYVTALPSIPFLDSLTGYALSKWILSEK